MSNISPDRSVETVRKIFERTKPSLERAPILRAIFERFASASGAVMRAISGPQCTFTLNSIVAGNLWDLIEPYEDAICGIFFCPEWDTRILIGFDRRFTYSLMEASFGGDGTEPPFESDRPFSPIEARVAKEAFILSAEALDPLLEIIEKTRLIFERMEGRLDFSTIGIDDTPAVMAQYVAQVLDGGGRMFVVIPHAALLPFRRRLEKERSPEPVHQDTEWGDLLLAQIGLAGIDLNVVLDGPVLSMNEITKLRVGQVLTLEAQIDDLVPMVCSGISVFRCKVGKSAGRFTAQIVHRLES